MTARIEFSRRTKHITWVRSQGHCEKCTAKLFPGNIEYHHVTECTFGGDDSVGNCLALCRACHQKITGARAPVIAKSSRIRDKHIGIKRPRRIRAWRKFNGDAVFARRKR